jgi:hypothetical protein
MVAILLRGTDFLSQKEKMALVENFARNALTLVMAGDSSGLGSDRASVVKIVKGELQRKNVWSNLYTTRLNTASLTNPPQYPKTGEYERGGLERR